MSGTAGDSSKISTGRVVTLTAHPIRGLQTPRLGLRSGHRSAALLTITGASSRGIAGNMASLDEAKQILKRDVNGRSLYDHLSEVLLKVLVDKPADALDSFEHVSAAIKRLALAPKPVPDYADDVDDAQTTRITVRVIESIGPDVSYQFSRPNVVR